jgi:phosphoribosyl 1,2-cyclic phosphodiesterase
MSLQVASLNSGSNGNCYYIGNRDEAVLIDAGISCRETERRMRRLELCMKKVKAIFITHEHSDHINGLHRLIKKYKIPFFITQNTRRNQALGWSESMAVDFKAYQPIQIGGLTVTAFPKFHDASDPHSFIVSNNKVNVGIFTDMGRICEHLVNNFKLCHAAFLESNYDEDMLENGPYPLHLKRRIRGGEGHLSNKEALQFFLNHRPMFMSHLFLSHLSKINNRPELVENLFKSVSGITEVIIAHRTNETPVYTIEDLATANRSETSTPRGVKVNQLSLFG